ncbi:hypothetical protein GCM10028807_24080 [Spirosoma daeguense]
MDKIASNLIGVAYTSYQDKIGGQFKPDQRFYSKVGINRKRFGQLLRGEKPVFGYEARALSDFFGIPVTDLL